MVPGHNPMMAATLWHRTLNNLQAVQAFFFVRTKMSWRTLLTAWYPRQPVRINVQSCPVL